MQIFLPPGYSFSPDKLANQSKYPLSNYKWRCSVGSFK